MTPQTGKHSKGKTIVLIVGVILIALVKVFGPRIYRAYQLIEACPHFISDPQKAAESCDVVIKASAQKSQKEREDLDMAHAVIWQHIARMHTGQDDRQEFESNSQSYLSDKWPGPVLAFYLGKITMDEMMAKAEARDPKDSSDQKCEAIYYAGEAYLQKGMKDEAIKNFQLASTTCPSDFVEKINADVELAALKP